MAHGTRTLLAVALALTLCGLLVERVAAMEKATDLDDLETRAGLIVLSTVVGMQTIEVNESNFIQTVVTVLVQNRLKGASADQIKVQVPGGQLDDVALDVAGEPEFEVGQHVLLFLQPDGGVYRVSGRSRGKFTLRDDRVVENGRLAAEFVDQVEAIVRSHR
jgi:hypothetical protein